MLKDKVAIVTGASRGIGQAIALELARQGAKLVLTASSAQSLMDTESKLREQGCVHFIGVPADVKNSEQVNSVVKNCIDTYSRVDILANNAGITRDNLLALMSESEWDDVLNTNLKSAFLFSKACSRPMIRQKGGSIINISSVVGLTGNAGQANYAASKAGLIGFTKSVAKELAKKNVRANVVAPGFIRTKMTDMLSDEIKQKVAAQIALGRLGEPEEIASVVSFLASDASRYMTGQVLVVDGGLVI
jgi:3-oxoacyl-[acyl-carrier protein] reductase